METLKSRGMWLELLLILFFSWTTMMWADYTSTQIIHREGAIPIFLACDNNYVQPCATTIVSVSKNSGRTFDFYILDCGISEENIRKINNWNLGKDRIFTIKVHLVSAFMNRMGSWPPAMFTRILIPEIFTDLDKGIYMDCDMICTGDLGSVWDIDMSGRFLGAAQDECDQENNKRVLKIPPQNFYFNSGFLLLNLAALRDFHLTDKVIQYLTQNKGLPVSDQDCLNVLFSDQSKVLELGKRFNAWQDKHRGQQIILHFVIRKPWKLPLNFIKYFPFRFREWCLEYYRYLALTPFAEEAKTNGSWKYAFSDAIWKTFEQPIENFIRNIKFYFKTFGEPK